jgi:hypothetical protein
MDIAPHIFSTGPSLTNYRNFFRERQTVSAAKINVRIFISLLLALCLLTVAIQTKLSVDLQDTRTRPRTFLFTPAFLDCVVSASTHDRRTNYNSFNELFNGALILRQILFDFTRGSSLFLTEYSASFAHRVDRAAIPIRASPFPYKHSS